MVNSRGYLRNFCAALVAFLVMLTTPLYAQMSMEPLLNTVALQLSAEQWVQTKTALVTIGVNASLSDANLEKAQAEIMGKLSKISNKGEWHLVSFNRVADQSGLERVQISAQARLPSDDLSGLRDRAKMQTTPGETFTLDNVEFIPSEEELRAANTALRNNIYAQAKVELDRLNTLYPDQKFYIHQINFVGGMMPMVTPQPKAFEMSMVAVARTASVSSNIAVGNKLQITATVVFASAANIDMTKTN